jgi:hypothetical protein
MPYSLQGWNDWRLDWIGNEVAVDYNAGFNMALALAIQLPKDFWIKAQNGECATPERSGGAPHTNHCLDPTSHTIFGYHLLNLKFAFRLFETKPNQSF